MRTENTDDLAGQAIERFMGEDRHRLAMFTDTEYHELREAILWAIRQAQACAECGQIDEGQTGEHSCPACGLPIVHDEALKK